MKSGVLDMQRRIAYEAARLMAEYRTDDVMFAIKKAAARLGVKQKHHLPTTEQVRQALKQQQSLFRGNEQQGYLAEYREIARWAMDIFKDFKPKLLGAVAEGTADENSHILIYLYADTAEEVMFRLYDKGMPWQDKTVRALLSGQTRRDWPGFQFMAGQAPVQLVVLPIECVYAKPLSPLDGKPLVAIDNTELAALMAAEQPGDAVVGTAGGYR